MNKRFQVDERSGIIAVYDTHHNQYHETEGCHADYPWVVCHWSGHRVEQEDGSTAWSLDPRWVRKAEEACELLNELASSERATSAYEQGRADYERMLEEATARAGRHKMELEKVREALGEAILQIEYLHEKFPKTGTSEAVLTRLRSV